MERKGTLVLGFAVMLCTTPAAFATDTPFPSMSPCAPEPSVATTQGSPSELIAALASAYSDMDLDRYAALFTNPAQHGIEFRFVLFEPNEKGEKEWGYDEEMRIHRRMFRPETIPSGDRPLPPELWVRSIDAQLEMVRGFEERWDLYRSEQNPAADLDRHRWRAVDGIYATRVTWHLASDRSLAIAGQARFVVVEDLLTDASDPNRFLIYRWRISVPATRKSLSMVRKRTMGAASRQRWARRRAEARRRCVDPTAIRR
jgi:hypothetical protein